MENLNITKNGIELLYKAINEKRLDNLNLVLQVSACKAQESINKKMIRCTLMDSVYKTSAVIIPGQDQEFDDNDLLKIDQIYGQGNSSSSNKSTSLIVVKKSYIIKKNYPVHYDIDSLINFNSRNIGNKQPENSANNHTHQQNIQNNNYGGMNKNNNNEYSSGMNMTNQGNSNYQNIHQNDQDDRKYMKINSLSSFTKEICIKARVTKKADKKNYTTQAGKSGCVFGFNIIDDLGDELPVSAFNQNCEKFYDKIEENMVYEITGGYIKINDKKYSSIKSEYKLFLDDKTDIKPLQDDGRINKVNFKFIKIEELPTIEQYSSVDIRAMVVEIGEKTLIRTKKMDEREVRKIHIGDSSGYKVEVTIWGKKSDFAFDVNTVYGFKCLKVNNYKGKTLNLGDESQIVELDDKEAMSEKMICADYQGNFKNLPIDKIEENNAQVIPIKSIKEITDMLDASDDDKFKFPLCKVKANIVTMNLNERSYYVGCPDCKKKIAENDNECQYCRKNFNSPAYYYSLNIRLKDHSGDFYADVLGAVGEKVMKMSCEDFKDMMNSGDEERQKDLVKQVESQTNWFVISPKLQVYNDIKRKRFSIIRVNEVDAQKNAEYILEAFMKLPQFN